MNNKNNRGTEPEQFFHTLFGCNADSPYAQAWRNSLVPCPVPRQPRHPPPGGRRGLDIWSLFTDGSVLYRFKTPILKLPYPLVMTTMAQRLGLLGGVALAACLLMLLNWPSGDEQADAAPPKQASSSVEDTSADLRSASEVTTGSSTTELDARGLLPSRELTVTGSAGGYPLVALLSSDGMGWDGYRILVDATAPPGLLEQLETARRASLLDPKGYLLDVNPTSLREAEEPVVDLGEYRTVEIGKLESRADGLATSERGGPFGMWGQRRVVFTAELEASGVRRLGAGIQPRKNSIRSVEVPHSVTGGMIQVAGRVGGRFGWKRTTSVDEPMAVSPALSAPKVRVHCRYEGAEQADSMINIGLVPVSARVPQVMHYPVSPLVCDVVPGLWQFSAFGGGEYPRRIVDVQFGVSEVVLAESGARFGGVMGTVFDAEGLDAEEFEVTAYCRDLVSGRWVPTITHENPSEGWYYSGPLPYGECAILLRAPTGEVAATTCVVDQDKGQAPEVTLVAPSRTVIAIAPPAEGIQAWATSSEGDLLAVERVDSGIFRIALDRDRSAGGTLVFVDSKGVELERVLLLGESPDTDCFVAGLPCDPEVALAVADQVGL